MTYIFPYKNHKNRKRFLKWEIQSGKPPTFNVVLLLLLFPTQQWSQVNNPPLALVKNPLRYDGLIAAIRNIKQEATPPSDGQRDGARAHRQFHLIHILNLVMHEQIYTAV